MQAVKNYGGMEVWRHTFLTSALEIKFAMYCTSTNIACDVHMLKKPVVISANPHIHIPCYIYIYIYKITSRHHVSTTVVK
jgi:hypothetical protein